MRRRARWFATAVALCLVGSAGFYVGSQYSEAKFLQRQLAAGTVYKVMFLQEFDDKLPSDARVALAAELPSLVANLDEELTRPAVLFVDYKRIKEARNLGLAYLKAYPPKKTPGPSSDELKGALSKLGFYMNPSAEGWKRSEEIDEAEERVDKLLSSFDPAKLDSESRAVYESLTKEPSVEQEEDEPLQRRPPRLRRPAAK